MNLDHQNLVRRLNQRAAKKEGTYWKSVGEYFSDQWLYFLQSKNLPGTVLTLIIVLCVVVGSSHG